MGFNTVVYIHNDLIPNADGKEVLQSIIQQMASHGARERAKGSVAQVISCYHSSHTILIAVGHNCFTVLHHPRTEDSSHHDREGQVRLLRSWAKELGFDLRKRKSNAR